MFLHSFLFELKYWFKRPLLYVFTFFMFLFLFLDLSNEFFNISGGSDEDLLKENSAYAIRNFYVIMSLLAPFFTAAFVADAARKDMDSNFEQIIATTKVTKWDLLIPKFLASFLVACLPYLGILLADILAQGAPWIEARKLAPVSWAAHFTAMGYIIIPNTLLMGSILYVVAANFKNNSVHYIGAIGIIALRVVVGTFSEKLDNKSLGAILEPFGDAATNLQTENWNTLEKSYRSIALQDELLYNRLLWVAVAIAIFAVGYYFVSFTKKNTTITKDTESNTVNNLSAALPTVHTQATSTWQHIKGQVKIDWLASIQSPLFLVFMVCGFLIAMIALFNADVLYGLETYPVTYQVIAGVNGSLAFFQIIFIAITSGVLLWREKDAKMNEIYDALPHKTAVVYVSKWLALVAGLVTMNVVSILVGIIYQLWKGYTDIDITQYCMTFLVWGTVRALFLSALAIFLQAMCNNKYVGIFLFFIIYIGKSILLAALDVKSKVWDIFYLPASPYSDMNKYGDFMGQKIAYAIYGGFLAILLLIIGSQLLARGKNDSIKERFLQFKNGFKHQAIAVLVTTVAFIGMGYYIYTQTTAQSRQYTREEEIASKIHYEKTYKKYETLAQPRLVDLKYNLDLYPEQHTMKATTKAILKNKSQEPITELLLLVDFEDDFQLTIPTATLTKKDTICDVLIYTFAQPLAPQDSFYMEYTLAVKDKGLEPNMTVVDNGIFINNGAIFPTIGYKASGELEDLSDRKDNKLPAKSDAMPALVPFDKCGQACMKNYMVDGDWCTMETTISTSANQTAIAPGSLLKKWKVGDRNYFHYQLDKASLPFSSFLSAEYEVAREKWNGIDLEVYYNKKHAYNVKTMLTAMRTSLEYYTTNFGPYYHKQARIIEFPNYSSFAQAFPGTMPYSESIGFIANLEKKSDINMVHYVVAHEMGHQWWGEQVCGPEMQGSSWLSESMAQYSALMVMKKHYGEDIMYKFLRYEQQRYLGARASNMKGDKPLLRVENESHVFYQKGSVVMYRLANIIGEDKLNTALKQWTTEFAYKEPPYPNAYTLLAAFRRNTPDSLQTLWTESIEDMITYNQKISTVTMKQLPSKEYELTIQVESKKMRTIEGAKDKTDILKEDISFSDLGKLLGEKKEIPMNDWIDIGIFSKEDKDKEEVLGKKLYYQKHRITKKDNTFVIIVKEKPYQVAIDPYYMCLDENLVDNYKKVN